jgi:hypothetical protein
MLALTIDDRDRELIARYDQARPTDGPQVGDWIDFADGVRRRVSYIWPVDCFSADPGRGVGVQTSEPERGRWYLGDGYCSYSGALYAYVRADTLALTDERRTGDCWTFHHAQMRAHNGITFDLDWPVWACTLEAPK